MRTIAITSGKGGVGKTNLSANLAIALADMGQKVVIFDADIGLANLDVILGCRTTSNLQDYVSGSKRLVEVLHTGPSGVKFIPGGSGLDMLFSFDKRHSERFFKDLAALQGDTDFLIFDTGAGLDGNVMSILNTVDEVLLVVTPDPASLSDGYATAKALFSDNDRARINLVVNMVHDEDEAKRIHLHLCSVAQKFLNARFGYSGYVRFDMNAVALMRKRIPFVAGNPNLPASIDVANIASCLMGQVGASPRRDFASRLLSALSLRVRKLA